MAYFAATHPVATTACMIEDIVIAGKNSDSWIVQGESAFLSRLISITVFPIFLALELVFKRIPKLILSIGDQENFNKKADKLVECALGILTSPLGLHSPEGVSGFFLKRNAPNAVRPFGVEKIYGKDVDKIFDPKTAVELKEIVLHAKENKKQISIIGAGMSQGTQTVPTDSKKVVINMKHLKKMNLSDDTKTVTVQAGANWEELQAYLNKHGKSSIVKQASDVFSIGGSLGINCHGWAHEYGAIASTVESLTIIDANGDLRKLTPEDELFGCMFGTLGYFGVIVDATLKVLDNDMLIEKTDEIELKDFIPYYESQIKGNDIPLFGGRLVLDQLDGNPLRKVCMVRYERDKDQTTSGFPSREFRVEPATGTRVERIGLKLISHLSNFSVKRMLNWLWTTERAQMLEGRKITRNEALHPPIKAFNVLRDSHLHAQWLQEYFIKKENLPNFLRFLGADLKANDVRLINATIRPVPKDEVSILPYADQDRYAVVICFAQEKTNKEVARTKEWIETVNQYLVSEGDVFYQAYMPYATREEFEKAYGEERVALCRQLKEKYDPQHVFGNEHTSKYFDAGK